MKPLVLCIDKISKQARHCKMAEMNDEVSCCQFVLHFQSRLGFKYIKIKLCSVSSCIQVNYTGISKTNFQNLLTFVRHE